MAALEKSLELECDLNRAHQKVLAKIGVGGLGRGMAFQFGYLGDHLGKTLMVEPKEMAGDVQVLSIIGVLTQCLYHADGHIELKLDVWGNEVTIDDRAIRRVEIVPAVPAPFSQIHAKLMAEFEDKDIQNCRCALPEPKTFDGCPDFRAARWEW